MRVPAPHALHLTVADLPVLCPVPHDQSIKQAAKICCHVLVERREGECRSSDTPSLQAIRGECQVVGISVRDDQIQADFSLAPLQCSEVVMASCSGPHQCRDAVDRPVDQFRTVGVQQRVAPPPRPPDQSQSWPILLRAGAAGTALAVGVNQGPSRQAGPIRLEGPRDSQ